MAGGNIDAIKHGSMPNLADGGENLKTNLQIEQRMEANLTLDKNKKHYLKNLTCLINKVDQQSPKVDQQAKKQEERDKSMLELFNSMKIGDVPTN